MTELPGEMIEPDMPVGTPLSDASRAADVWCRHGLRWQHQHEGYVCDDPAHYAIPCRDYGAIPEPCQPAVPYPPDQFPNSGPGAVRDVLGELP